MPNGKAVMCMRETPGLVAKITPVTPAARVVHATLNDKHVSLNSSQQTKFPIDLDCLPMEHSFRKLMEERLD
jgi:hypothetical protein